MAPIQRILGCDFGVPTTAGAQARKIILIEATQPGPHRYQIAPCGRNERLIRDCSRGRTWQERRQGWTVPELTTSLVEDPAIAVIGFDFPFSLPVSLLKDAAFAAVVGQPAFETRKNWARFVASQVKLAFPSMNANAKLSGLDHLAAWRHQRFWIPRVTDRLTRAAPPLKHLYQNVFAMTLMGAAMLEQLSRHGFTLALCPESLSQSTNRVAFETYPAMVARACGFEGSYKKEPVRCMEQAERYLKDRGIVLDFDAEVRQFCRSYRTAGKRREDADPDGADAFLCLVAAICYHEHEVEWYGAEAALEIRQEEGSIVAPRPFAKESGRT